MTPIQIMALVFAIIAAIKIVIILVQPKTWTGVVNAVYGNKAITMIVSLILAVILLNFLLAELTIVQIFAVMLFMSPLLALGVTAYNKELMTFGKKMLRDRKIVKKAWLSIVVWIVLIIWVLYTLLV
jgi:hypothetical protein